MLYGNETDLDRQERTFNIQELCSKFLSIGGFGVILDNLVGSTIKQNDINAQIEQEDSLAVLYEEVFSKTIDQELLEQKYLGRKKLNIIKRVQRHLCKYRLPMIYEKYNKDPFYHFMMNNTINGYMNRLYWKEWEEVNL
uniref:Uncharacterized protein n=1 Tax=viral metagenome TaxID=1070528 RepID=A0A6C0J0M3_9ZZZZ